MKLHIDHVSKSYQKGNIKALNNIDIELTPGVYGLLGPNGAGKSTLINLLVGNLKADSGSIKYNDVDIHMLGQKYREVLGYMPQQQQLYDDFTGLRFLWYVAALKGIPKKQAQASISRLLEIVNLQEHAHKRMASYSGGMKQRILIAQSLLNDPNIIILDEPTAGLDPKERINIRNFISTIALNKIVIIATHVVTDIESIAKKVILLKKGNLIAMDEPTQLLKRMEGHVFEVSLSDAEQLSKLQSQYRISSISNDSRGLCARVLSDIPPTMYPHLSVHPNLEDLYLYSFDSGSTFNVLKTK